MKTKIPTFGLCIDWETSGSDWGKDSSIRHQGISFGAVIFNTTTFEPVETLYREVKFNDAKYVWSNDAEKIHGLSREHLNKNGITQEDAAYDLLELLVKYFAGTSVIVLGHNNEFDKVFTNQLLNSIDVEFAGIPSNKFDTVIPIHHVNLDTSGIGFVTLGIYKSDLLFDALALPKREFHNALEDALMTLEAAKRIKLLVQEALNG